MKRLVKPRGKPITEELVREPLLDRFQAKAGCVHTQEAAHRLWRRLQEHLTPKQADQLLVAWGHHANVGEGCGELGTVCWEIRKAWRGEEVAFWMRGTMSGTKYDKDPRKCCCLDWAESPYTGYRKEGGHHPKCPEALRSEIAV